MARCSRIDSRPAQVGLVHLGVLQPRAGQVGTAQHSLAQIRLDQAGFAQSAVGQVDATQVRCTENGQREVDLDKCDRPDPAFGEHRTEETAVPKRAVQQRSPAKRAIAER